MAITGEPLSLYGQIGMILLVGLASKSAILIVKFGKSLRESEGMDLLEATVGSAKLRFRPVVMTGLSFVVGDEMDASIHRTGVAMRHTGIGRP